MANEVYAPNQGNNFTADLKLKDVEEKQDVMRDRLLLIGQNLIETKTESADKFLEIKKDMEMLKESILDMKSYIESIMNEIPKFARKDDLEILKKQAKMFQPLEFVRKSELKKMEFS